MKIVLKVRRQKLKITLKDEILDISFSAWLVKKGQILQRKLLGLKRLGTLSKMLFCCEQSLNCRM